LQESKTLINNTLQNVRNISKAILPMVLEKFGLKKSVDQIAEGVNLSKHTHCKVLIEDSFPHLDTALELSIYRITQELVSNALKYAEASTITLRFYLESERIYFIYEDNGIGFNLKEAQNRLNIYSSGLGLKNIESRVSSFEGELEVYTAPKQGTRFEISFPDTFLLEGKLSQEMVLSNGVSSY